MRDRLHASSRHASRFASHVTRTWLLQPEIKSCTSKRSLLLCRWKEGAVNAECAHTEAVGEFGLLRFDCVQSASAALIRFTG